MIMWWIMYALCDAHDGFNLKNKLAMRSLPFVENAIGCLAATCFWNTENLHWYLSNIYTVLQHRYNWSRGPWKVYCGESYIWSSGIIHYLSLFSVLVLNLYTWQALITFICNCLWVCHITHSSMSCLYDCWYMKD
jgi:hypothetical protein